MDARLEYWHNAGIRENPQNPRMLTILLNHSNLLQVGKHEYAFSFFFNKILKIIFAPNKMASLYFHESKYIQRNLLTNSSLSPPVRTYFRHNVINGYGWREIEID